MTLRLYTPAGFALMMACVAPVGAQQLIGYVNTHDAEVTGASDVLDGQAVLTGSAGVTAKDHTAAIKLGRGGTVQVCQTSSLHVTESRTGDVEAPLLFSLEHGAIELQTAGVVTDGILTPDLRFALVSAGPLDLRVRVALNGDTCVENRGPNAPTIDISDPFGTTLYQVSAGQHVMFEHGSLHEVVDRETTPCGCPEPQQKPTEKKLSVADALLASGKNGSLAAAPEDMTPTPAPEIELQSEEQTAATAAVKAAEAHPFPEAISEGLEPPAQAPPPPPGAGHTVVTDTLSYNAPAPATASAPAPPASAAAAPEAKDKKAKKAKKIKSPAAASEPPPEDLVHVVGRFFKKIFGR